MSTLHPETRSVTYSEHLELLRALHRSHRLVRWAIACTLVNLAVLGFWIAYYSGWFGMACP